MSSQPSILSPVTTTHIFLDQGGVAWIDDTNVKVKEIVLDKLTHGWSPEEIHVEYPFLALAQIYSALAYYHDHQAAMDAEIDRDYQEYQAFKARAGESPLRKRWRDLGIRP